MQNFIFHLLFVGGGALLLAHLKFFKFSHKRFENLRKFLYKGHTMGQLFQGVVSNCKQGVLSTTSGKITTTAFTQSVSGSINTTHSHYTTFDIGNMGFKLKGDYPLRDGDEVVCYAIKIRGYYLVETLKNVTRNYFASDRFGSLWWYYLGIISGILSACVAIILAVLPIIYPSIITYPFVILTSGWCITSFAGAIVAKPRYKQNKIIENYNPHLTQADNIALTQAQLENESKKNAQRRFSFLMGLLSLLFWALVGALASLMLFLVSGTINEVIKAQWAKSISLWFKDNENMPITWVVATLVLWVLNFINKRKQISVISIFMRLFLGLLGGFGVMFIVYLALESRLETYMGIVLAIWPITTLVLWIFGVFGFIRKRIQNKIAS